MNAYFKKVAKILSSYINPISPLLICLLAFYLLFTVHPEKGLCNPSGPDAERINLLIQEVFQPRDLARKGLIDEVRIYKCATPIIRAALKYRDLLWAENQFILYRPTNPIYKESSYYYGNVPVWYYDSPQGHFRIHYTEYDTADSLSDHRVYGYDGNPSTRPPYVENLATYLDQVWTKEIDEMGYAPPTLDGSTDGGTNLFDVYVMDINAYGYTAIENSYAYMVIHNDFIGYGSNYDPEGSQKGNMKVTAAHEFFHAIQYDYNNWSSEWWEEMTAVWMEDEVFDYVDDYLRYLPDRLDNLDLPLDYGDILDGHIVYGGVIWATFLAENYGVDFIRHVFERSYEISYHSAKQATEDTLHNYNSNWGEALTQFCLKNLTLDYEEGYQYFDRHTDDYFTDIIGNNGNIRYYSEIDAGYTSDPETINHLAAHYFMLEAGATTQNLRVTLTQQGTIAPTTLLVADQSDTGDPSWEIIKDDIHVWPKKDMEFVLNGFGDSGTYSRAFLIVINPDPSNNCDYTWTADFNSPVLDTPVIHNPDTGKPLIFEQSNPPFSITLSVQNIPFDPNHDFYYTFELYQGSNLTLLDTNTVSEDPNGITSYQVQVDQDGIFYYWRCQAKTEDPDTISFWTPMSSFYPLVIHRDVTQAGISSDPSYKMIQVSDPNSPIYGFSIELKLTDDPNDSVFLAHATTPSIPTGNIIPIGNWVYFGPEDLSLTNTATMTLRYTQQDLDNAGITDPNYLWIYQLQTKNPYLYAPLSQISSSHDPNNRTLEADIDHFSLYIVGFSTSQDPVPGNSGPVQPLFKSGGGCFISVLPPKHIF